MISATSRGRCTAVDCALNGVVTEAALREAGYDPTPFDRRYTGNSNFARIRGFRTLASSVLGIVGMGEIGRRLSNLSEINGAWTTSDDDH